MIKPKVSVVIPNKDRTDQVIEAIEMVNKQSYQNIEIIIVDDSDDKTYNKLREAFRNNIRVRIERGDGINDVDARFKGAYFSTGKYICFLDSDDSWLPAKLEEHVNLFESSKIALRFTTDAFVHDDGKIASLNDIIYAEKITENGFIINGDDQDPINVMFGAIPSHSSSICISRQYLVELVPFDDVPFDTLLFVKTFPKYPIGFIKTPLTVIEPQNNEKVRLSNDTDRLLMEKCNIKSAQVATYGKKYFPVLFISLIYNIMYLLFFGFIEQDRRKKVMTIIQALNEFFKFLTTTLS